MAFAYGIRLFSIALLAIRCRGLVLLALACFSKEQPSTHFLEHQEGIKLTMPKTSKRPSERDGSERPLKRVTSAPDARQTASARHTQATVQGTDAPPSARREAARLAMVAAAVAAARSAAITKMLYRRARQAAMTKCRLRDVFTEEEKQLVNAVRAAVIAGTQGVGETVLREAQLAVNAAAARRRAAGGAVAAAAAASTEPRVPSALRT